MTRAKKHNLFWDRVVHFWTRIWSGRGDGLRAGAEEWDGNNTVNGDGCKIQGSDGETSNIKN